MLAGGPPKAYTACEKIYQNRVRSIVQREVRTYDNGGGGGGAEQAPVRVGDHVEIQWTERRRRNGYVLCVRKQDFDVQFVVGDVEELVSVQLDARFAAHVGVHQRSGRWYLLVWCVLLTNTSQVGFDRVTKVLSRRPSFMEVGAAVQVVHHGEWFDATISAVHAIGNKVDLVFPEGDREQFVSQTQLRRG